MKLVSALLIFNALAFHVSALSSSSSSSSSKAHEKTASVLSRRGIIAAAFSTTSAVLLGSSFVVFHPDAAHAFPNAIPDYAKYTEKNKRRGTAPKDLGIRMRTTEGEEDVVTELGLRSCDGNPNCFSTTGDFLLSDRQQYGVDFLIPPWMPPVDDPNPFQTLKTVVKAYEPGQGGIDGGGFGVIEETNSYLYCQFESLKKGFIDDVEFAVVPNREGVLVRSASRLGFTDFGVNAIRLNYIASKLRDKGWSIPDITPNTHRDYWNAAEEAREATFDPDRRRMASAE